MSNKDPRQKPASGKPGSASPEIKPARPNSTTTKPNPEKPVGSTLNRPQTTMSARALSRYEIDQRNQRYLTFAVIGVVTFVVLVLAFGIWQTTLAPSFQTLAKVGDTSLTRNDYNKFRKITLFKQYGSLSQQLNFVQGDQATQIQNQLAFIADEVANVTDRPIDQPTLESLVNQTVMERAAKDKFGITVNSDDINKSLTEDFGNVIYTPTPNPSQSASTASAIPAQTQLATFQTATAGAITPLPTPTPSVSPSPAVSPVVSGTVSPATTPGLTPGTTAGGTPGASPGISGTVTVSGTVTATPSPTATSTAIAQDRFQQTVQANQSSYLSGFRTFTRLSDDDYRNYEARPALVKKQVISKLRLTLPKIGDPYPQTKVSHILIKEEADARKYYDELKAAPADKFVETFIRLAREKSTDTVAAAQNGDLGWTTDKTQFDKDFLAAALKLEKGQFSEPVKTQFGYHIIYATDKDPKRPLDALTIQPFEGNDNTGDPAFFGDWVKERVKENNVSYNTPPTPAPTATVLPLPVFTPVVPPTATSTPPPTPVATTAAATTASGTTSAATTPGGTTSATTSGASTTTTATTVAATTPAVTTASSSTTVASTPTIGASASPVATPSPTR